MQNDQPGKELSILAQQWLSQMGYKIHPAWCKEEISSHPDYPALTALTDFLENGGMDYEAVQADISYIHEFNYPLLAHIRQPGNEFLHLVADAEAWKNDELAKDWSGIVIYAAPGAVWQHEGNEQRKKADYKKQQLAVAGVFAGIALFMVSVWSYPHWLMNAFGLLSLAGLAAAIAAWTTELGYKSRLVKQVCGLAGKSGCEQVLQSRYARGFAGITPADASVVYFITQLAVYFAGCLQPSLHAGMICFSLAGPVIVAWSLYTQAVKLKQWCVLCLAIAGVLALQSVLAFAATGRLSFAGEWRPVLVFPAIMALVAVGFIPLKQLMSSRLLLRKELSALKKWKTDAALFLAQWEQEQAADVTLWNNDLLLGHADAPVRITVACNPYCSPCARAHEQLDQLLAQFKGKVSVQVRLLCLAGNRQDKRTMAVTALLQKAAEINNNYMLQEMLADWFRWMDLDKWQQKWRAAHAADVSDVLQQHAAWMNDAAIAFTPTFFINGRRLPGRYQLADLEKLIPQLAGAFSMQAS